MRKSLKRAKQDALAVWRYLAEHGEVSDKEALPAKLLKKVENDISHCPLCTMFRYGGICGACPLSVGRANCLSVLHPYNLWNGPFNTSEGRAAAAREIVHLIEAWEV